MFQNTIIAGNLGRDPEMRYTPSGTAVTNFTVAVNRRFTDREGNKQEKVTWFRVTAWNKLAEICNEYLHKGDSVLVEGDVAVSAWSADDGSPRATLELTAKTVRFFGSKGHEAHTDESFSADDEMPF